MTSEKQSLNADNWLVAVGRLDPTAAMTSIQLDSGRVVSLPTALLAGEATTPVDDVSSSTMEPMVIPVIEEQLVVTKRQVALETVRLVKTVEEKPEQVEVELARERWDIQHVPVETEVTERTGMRVEGETSVYPLFEERTVTRKALFLVEEIHVRKIIESRSEIVSGTVKRDVITVERVTP